MQALQFTRAAIQRYEVFRIPLDVQGYDKRGTYYGVGEKLWIVYDLGPFSPYAKICGPKVCHGSRS